MTNKTTKYFILTLCLTALFLSACRPPMKCIDNKSTYYKSTKTKRRAATLGKINTTGTFVTLDTTRKLSDFSLIKFNLNQTVQVSTTRESVHKPLSLNNTYTQYLDNRVSYYYYVDNKAQTLILERFEYWDAPWWNFFVQTNHYIVERFYIKGDTLINQATNNHSRFGRQYVLDKNLIFNYDIIENEFLSRHE